MKNAPIAPILPAMTDTTPDNLIEFPCHFPIKIMGLHCSEFEIAVLEIIRRHSPDLAEDAIRSRPSKGNKYLALTITIVATSREQLDNIYRELSAHELVTMAL